MKKVQREQRVSIQKNYVNPPEIKKPEKKEPEEDGGDGNGDGENQGDKLD